MDDDIRAVTAEELADPPHHRSEDGACPSCGARWRKTDDAGFSMDHLEGCDYVRRTSAEDFEREYAVETLVHLNLTIRVKAPNGYEAFRRAKEICEQAYPDAALVDPVNWEE
jgi:hypothetical protein